MNIYVVYFMLLVSSIHLAWSNQSLDINGENVCQQTVYYSESYTVTVTYTATEYYTTCCAQFLWCWNSCTRSRETTKTRQETRYRTKSRVEPVCCAGYRRDGNSCPIPICDDGCKHGTCILPNNCSCNIGFEGDDCSSDINECNTTNGGCAQKCVNSMGSYACVCFDGYTYNETTKECKDVNECQLSENVCKCASNMSTCNATCINTIGGFQCSCSPGYELADKTTCVDLDECTDSNNNGNCSHICRNLIGSHSCECPIGLYLLNDSRTCNDTNECLLNNGRCSHYCVNLYGSYKCQCRDGYKLDLNGYFCYDIDECNGTNHECEICENKIGGYRCTCSNGFKLNTDNKTCSDFDECKLIEGTSVSYSGCSQRCNNTNGSFQCICDPGYSLASDNRTCSDINECRERSHRCNHICVNTIGSYSCICSDGYKLAEDMLTCKPEACVSLPVIVNGNASCLTGFTGSSCQFRCYQGFELEGDLERFCLPNHKWNGTQTYCRRKQCNVLTPPVNGKLIEPCNNYYEGKCTASCLDGYFLDGKEINECGIEDRTFQMKWLYDQTCRASTACNPNPCLHGGSCSTKKQSFVCNCLNTMYYGLTCNQGIVKVPQMPIQRPNTTNHFYIEAKPDEELIVEIVSNSSKITITPTLLTFTTTMNKLRVSVQGLESGFSTIYFKLSGKNADVFTNPGASTIYVSHTYVTQFSINTEGRINNGCFTENRNNIELLSNSQWIDGTTGGITQVVTKDGNTLPLSLTGGQFSNTNNFVNQGFDGNVIEGGSVQDMCNRDSTPAISIGEAVVTNAVLYSIESIFNTHSPYWISFTVATFSSTLSYNDVEGKLFFGNELLKREDDCTNGYRFEKTHIYYVLKTNQDINIMLPTSVISLSKEVKKCFIVDVSGETSTYLTFIPNHEDLLAKFHKELSDLLQIGTLKPKQLSFTRHESNADIFSISGERTFSVYSEKVNVTINLRGNMQWNISDFNKLPNANHSYVLSLTQNGYIHVQLTYELEGNIQNIDKSGQLIYYEEQRLSNSTKSKIILVSDNNDTFKTNFEFVTYENKKPVPSSISVLFEPYRNDLVIIEEFVANSFTNLTSPVGAASLSFRNGTANLIGLLSANQLQMKKKAFFIEDLGAIRRQSIQTVKLFSLLLDSYVRYDDPWDSLQLEQKFIDYRNSVDDFILNTNIPLDILKVDTAMQKSQIVLKYFCIGKYCLENVKTYLNVPDETLSGVAVTPVALSDFISFEKGNVLFYNVNTKAFNSNVNVALYSEEQSIDIKINGFNINLSFESGKIIPDDMITINVTGYLHGLIRKDPITFRIAGGISKTNRFHSKVNSEILSIVTKLKSSIMIRQRSMAIFYSKVKKDVVEKAIAYANNTKTVALLTNKLNTLTDKISQYENVLAGLKPIIDNYLQLQQNVISYNITNFSEKCQVKFCLSDCVPGLTKSICSEVQKLQLIDNICKFEQSSYTDKEIYTFPKVVEHTDYKDEVFCNRKCPILTQFFNNVLGRRKRRGIGSRLISAVAIASTFEKLGGTEGAIGALVGSSLGPVGALVGGVIGSIFGSCEKSCSYRQVPYKSYRNITSYGYLSIVHDMIISTCENKQREVEAGKTYHYGCEVESKCADVIIDQSCFDHQKECIEIRKQIDELINDATIKQQMQEYKEYSSLLDIEKRKKDVINAQLQNTLKDNSMTESLSSIANNSESSYKRSYEMFNKSIAAKLNFIEDFEKSKNIIEWSASFSFFHSIFQDFPQRILFNYQMHGKILTSFFDRQNYEKSVSDAAQEILKARMEMFGNANKRRRRSLQGEATATLAEKNCHVIQKAVFYLYNILVLIQNEINLYEAHILKGSSLEKTASKTYDLLKEQANLLSLGNQITSEIESYYNDIRDGKVTIDSWEQTYTSLITRLELTASLMEGTDCFSLRDCVDHHIDQMEKLLLHTNLAKKLNTTMLEDHYNVLLNSVPTLSEVKNLQTIAANELSASNLRASFCGKRPEILKLLDGERHVSEGDTIRLIILLKSESDGIKISWKHDRKYIKDASSFTYTSIAKSSDTGIYTCELTNDFGKTYCGVVLLHVHEILTFSEGLLPRNGFYRSPDPLILNCKTNYSGQYSRMWYFRAGKTSPKTLLTSNTDSLLIMQNDTGNSGYYSCKIIGQAKTIESEEILVNVLKTTIAVERLSISMNLFKQTLQRTRRSTEDRITDALAAQINIEKNQIVDLNLTKGLPNDGAKIVFTLHSNNLTKSLNNLADNETWDSNEDLTKLRDQLFSQVIQLFYKANSSMTFQIEEDLYKVKADSITIEPLAPYCPSGQILNENGLICSDCQPGTRQSSGSCISCSLNTYQELPAQTSCIPCDAPTFTLAEGSISRDQCLIPTTTMTTVSSSTTTRETTTPITATLGKKEDDGTNVAAIGGGIGAVVVVLIAIIAFLLYYRRRKTQKEPGKMNGTSNPVFDDEKADIPVGVLSFDLGSSHGATNEDPQYESIKHVKVRQEKVGFRSGSKEEEGAGYAKPVEPNHYEGVGMGFSNPAYGATFPNEKKNMQSAEYSRKNSYDQLYDCPRPQPQSHRPGSYEKLDVENRNSAKNRDQCYNDMSSMTFKK